jgi:hypothetical protein
MSGYNLYDSLDLSRAEPPEQLAQQLDRRIADLRSQGHADSSPQVSEATAARAVLGDATKRTEYDRRLDTPGESGPDIPWIVDLAQRSAASPWVAPAGTASGRGTPSLTELLKPLYIAAAAGVLLVLAVIDFFLAWGKATAEGETISMNGFGAASADGQVLTRTLFLYIALLVIVFLVAGTALLAVSSTPKAGALLAAVGGALLTLYGLYALITKMSADSLFGLIGGGGSMMDDIFGDTSIDAGIGLGAVFGVVIGVVTVAVAVLYVVRAPGRILPTPRR